jgi:hypothetical protein
LDDIDELSMIAPSDDRERDGASGQPIFPLRSMSPTVWATAHALSVQ